MPLHPERRCGDTILHLGKIFLSGDVDGTLPGNLPIFPKGGKESLPRPAVAACLPPAAAEGSIPSTPTAQNFPRSGRIAMEDEILAQSILKEPVAVEDMPSFIKHHHVVGKSIHEFI